MSTAAELTAPPSLVIEVSLLRAIPVSLRRELSARELSLLCQLSYSSFHHWRDSNPHPVIRCNPCLRHAANS